MDNFVFYNRHYIKTREDGAVTDAWSDGPLRDKSTEGAVCFNDKGGYQLRLIVDGVTTEENPPMRTREGIPVYKYVDGKIVKRTAEEIDADIALLPPPEPSEMERLRADVDFIMVMTDLM